VAEAGARLKLDRSLVDALVRAWRLERTAMRALISELPAVLNLYALLGLVAATKSGRARLVE
jgi:hypothetical protein